MSISTTEVSHYHNSKCILSFDATTTTRYNMERRSPKIPVERLPRTMLERLPPKSPVLYERYKSGCAWKLISFLDFCQGHSNKKPNSDTLHISSHTSGNEYVRTLLKLRKDLDKKSNNDRVNKKSLESDAGTAESTRTIEEKTSTDHRKKKQVSTAKQVQRGSNVTCERPKKHKKAGKFFSRPCYSKDIAIMGPTRASDKKLSSDKLTSTTETEEICNKVNHQPEIDSADKVINNYQLHEINFQVKMNEAAETFINQQLIHKDAANHKSKSFLAALDILNSNKELFIKLLQDPNSLLVKHIQDLNEDGKRQQQNKYLSEAHLSECRLSNEDHVCNEKLKSFESQFSNGSDDPSEIVLLKPRPTIVNNSADNSGEFHAIKFDHGLRQSVKPSAVFSLERVKRRLRHAIGVNKKEHPYKVPMSEAKDLESGFGHEVGSADENGQKISNLSIVRHNKQSEVDTCDEPTRYKSLRCRDEEFSTGNYRRGRELNVSTTARLRYSPYENKLKHLTIVRNESLNQHRHDVEASPLADMKEPNELLQTNVKKLDGSENFPDTESICFLADIDKPCHRDSIKAAETNHLEVLVEPGSMQNTVTDKNTDTVNTFDENQYSKCFDVDSALEIDASPSCEDADPNELKDKTGELSTSSLSEQFLTENTVTPTGTTSETNEEDTGHPIQIKVDEDHSESHLISSLDPSIYLIASLAEDGPSDEYTKAKLRTSDFNWDDFSMKCPSTVQQLDIESMENIRHCNPRLIDDYISELSSDIYRFYFRCSPWVSIIDSTISPLPTTEKGLVSEMKKHIDLDLVSQFSSPNLEQLAAKDLAKAGRWLDDLQIDLEDIVIETVEAVMEELITETWT